MIFKNTHKIIAVVFSSLIVFNSLYALEPEQNNQDFLFMTYNPPVKKSQDEKIWAFSLAGWYSRFTGNTNTLTSNLSSTLEMDNNISNFEISFSVYYNEVDDTATINEGNGILRYDHYLFPRIELFVFSQSEYNKMSLLDHRNSSGAGAKLVITRNDILKFDISSAFVYESEKYETKNYSKDYRISCRARVKLRPVNSLLINFTYFYIPKAYYARHYRLNMDVSAKLKINKLLAFKIGYINSYNKNALPGTEKTDENYYCQIELEY